MKLDSDDFELLGLARVFAQDRATLEQRRREAQAAVHPDRFAADGAAAQRVAMQWAVRMNEAYERVRDPLRRAAYLCELNGVAIDADNNTAMPTEFLMQQMEWREALDEARSAADVTALEHAVSKHRNAALDRLATALDSTHDYVSAGAQVRALMFVERFAADVQRRIDSIDVDA